MVKLNQRTKYPSQRSFISKVVVRTYTDTHTHTYTHTRLVVLRGPFKYSLIKYVSVNISR